MLRTAPLVLLLSLGAAEDEPSPREILEAAAIQQRADAVAGAVGSFYVRLYLQRRDADGSRLEFDVERKFQAPDRLWTRVEERAISGTNYQQGFDGKQAWLYDEKKNQVTMLDGPDYRTDRENIQQDLRMMRQLLRFFFLDNLVATLTDLQRLEDGKSSELESYVVKGRGRLPKEEGGTADVTIWVDKDTKNLLGVCLEFLDAETERVHEKLQFCFWYHRPNAQGVIVPGQIKLYRNNEEKPSETIAIDVDETRDVNRILFNAGVDDSVFQPPKTP